MNRWFLTLPIAFAASGALIQADSIWERRDPRYAHLFQDNRARRIGDLLTVVISESTTTNDKEQRANDKSHNASATASSSGSSSGGTGTGSTGSATFSLSDAFRRTFSGSAQLTSARTFTDRMTVTVVDVMPNGNLVIEGYRSRVVAGEERVLRVTGVIRPADVGTGNTIGSTAIANFRVTYLGRGPESRSVNQNWGGRLGNVLWPW